MKVSQRSPGRRQEESILPCSAVDTLRGWRGQGTIPLRLSFFTCKVRRNIAPRAIVIQGDVAPVVFPWYLAQHVQRPRGGNSRGKVSISNAGLQSARPGWEQRSVPAWQSLSLGVLIYKMET